MPVYRYTGGSGPRATRRRKSAKSHRFPPRCRPQAPARAGRGPREGRSVCRYRGRWSHSQSRFGKCARGPGRGCGGIEAFDAAAKNSTLGQKSLERRIARAISHPGAARAGRCDRAGSARARPSARRVPVCRYTECLYPGMRPLRRPPPGSELLGPAPWAGGRETPACAGMEAQSRCRVPT